MNKYVLIALIQEIAVMIECQMSLKHQDLWLDKIKSKGLLNIELIEDEEYEKGFKTTEEEE